MTTTPVRAPCAETGFPPDPSVLSVLVPMLLAAASAAVLTAYAWALPALGLHGPGLPVLLAIYTASVLSSIAGFAFSAISGALLFHLLSAPPVLIVQIMVVCSIAIQLMSVMALWNTLDWRALPPFLAGGIVSIPLGVFLLLHVQQHTYGIAMGVALAAYGTYMLFRRPLAVSGGGAWSDGLAGLMGGITGGFAGFPGAIVTIWCGLKGWDKTRQRGVYQPFILVMQVLTLAAIHVMSHGAKDAGLHADVYVYVPAALLGTWCGLAVFRRLTNQQFTSAVNLLLIVSGIGLAL